jgi:hypothetical protein
VKGKRASGQIDLGNPTPREQLTKQVRSGHYSPLADMEPIEVPPPSQLARMFPGVPASDLERCYVNRELEHRAKLLQQRLQTPLGLAQWFGTLGRRGIKVFEAFTVRGPRDRRDWRRKDGWLLVMQVDALVAAAPVHQRTKTVEWAIEQLREREPLKWGILEPSSLKTQYHRLTKPRKSRSKRAKPGMQ